MAEKKKKVSKVVVDDVMSLQRFRYLPTTCRAIQAKKDCVIEIMGQSIECEKGEYACLGIVKRTPVIHKFSESEFDRIFKGYA